MSALEASFSALRARFFSGALPQERAEEFVRTRVMKSEARGSCLRGLAWAVLFECVGLLTMFVLVHAWRIFHS